MTELENKAAKSLSFTCPNCQGKMVFDAESQKLLCLSCSYSREATDDKKNSSIVEYRLEEGLAKNASRGFGLATKAISCKGCGSIVSFEKSMTATQCSFCGSSQILELSDHRQVLTPESLVPFSIEQKTINALFSKWVHSLWLRPNALKKLARVIQVSGVYIPYWVFDARVHSDWQALAGYHYYVTETYTERDANGHSVTKTRQVQHTRWVPAAGSRDDFYDEFLICASKGLSQELAQKLKSFDTTQLKPYQPSFLSGWKAEEYQIDLNEGWRAAVQQMEQEQERRCSGDVPGDTQMALEVENRFSDERFKHVLLPIWISAYQYRDKTYQFLVNGQTGEVQGKAPWSAVKITFLVLTVLIVLALFALMMAQQQNAQNY